MSDNPRYSSTIARLRKQAGFSQEELAAKAGIGRATLQNIERGISSATVETLNSICIALGVTLQQIFTLREGDMVPASVLAANGDLAKHLLFETTLAKEKTAAAIAEQNGRMSKGAFEHSLMDPPPSQLAMAETILALQKENDDLKKAFTVVARFNQSYEAATKSRRLLAQLILTGAAEDKQAFFDLLRSSVEAQSEAAELGQIFSQKNRSS